MLNATPFSLMSRRKDKKFYFNNKLVIVWAPENSEKLTFSSQIIQVNDFFRYQYVLEDLSSQQRGKKEKFFCTINLNN